MSLLRRHLIASGITFGLVIAFLGSFLGHSFAVHYTNEMASQVKPSPDAINGVWITGVIIILGSSLLAAVVGIAAGLILYAELKRSAARRMSVLI
jgi:hypothetical protein